MTKYTSEEIKNRLSNIGEAIGVIALEYIEELENENEQLQNNNKHIRDLIEAERQRQEECNDVHLRDITTLEKENRELKLLKEKMENWINRIKKLKEEKEQLKAQIEQMKNHNNCKWFHEWNLADVMNEPLDDLSPCQGCKNFSLWELTE